MLKCYMKTYCEKRRQTAMGLSACSCKLEAKEVHCREGMQGKCYWLVDWHFSGLLVPLF
jgi:hypothetical protein